jgi:hypothetical protein
MLADAVFQISFIQDSFIVLVETDIITTQKNIDLIRSMLLPIIKGPFFSYIHSNLIS